jgi:hypothetical protein
VAIGPFEEALVWPRAIKLDPHPHRRTFAAQGSDLEGVLDPAIALGVGLLR